MRYLLKLSFEGTNYHGWQIQPKSVSVQQTLEKCLSRILHHEIKLVGVGRTDAGVHATMFFAHFDFDKNILCDNDFIYKLNSFLPLEISIINLFKVENDFHARFDALSRTYQYKLTNTKNPFMKNRFYFVKKEIDFSLMNLAALNLLGTKNFKCFSKVKSDVKTFDCCVSSAKWFQKENYWVFQISANRFLRNMVRAIVGTLIEIGEGKKEVNSIIELIKSKDRKNAGYSVPAHGLYLTYINYPSNIIKHV